MWRENERGQFVKVKNFEKDKNHEKYLQSTLVRGERDYIGIFYYRHQACVLKASIWYRKKRGESLIKTEFITQGSFGTKAAYIESPRYLQIDSVEMRSRWRADSVRNDLSAWGRDNLIFINENDYIKGALAHLPNIIFSGIYTFDEEKNEYEQSTLDLLKSKHIISNCLDFNWGDDMQKNALLMISSKICNYLVADNFVVHSWYESSKFNFR
jgi:hypothetical protein